MASQAESEGEVSLPASVDEAPGAVVNDSPDLGPEVRDESDGVSLPPSVEEDADDGSFCCKRGGCPKKFDKEELEEYKLQFSRLALADRQQRIYQKVLDVYKAGGEKPDQKFPWQLLGKPVCRRFWEKVHGMGHAVLDKYVAFAKANHTHVPEHAPKMPKSTPASDTLDTWFVGLYQHLAEPLAIPGSEDRLVGPELLDNEGDELLGVMQHEVVHDLNHPLLAFTVNAERRAHGQGPVKVPKRYLNFESDTELWQFYQADEEMSVQVSRNTFMKGWKSWQNFMPLKNRGQQSKCSICAEISHARTQATEKVARLELDNQKKAHLDICQQDRRINVRGNRLASKPEVWLKHENEDKFCKIQIDGMDQSKFALPRLKRLVGTSLLSKLWRPSVHVVGVICFGVLEYYALLPCDVPKDSNMNATVISRVLDLVANILRAKGERFSFPSTLLLALDNTPREGKNSFFASYLATLIQKKVFRHIQVEYMQVDHTHNELDQRFSSMAARIKCSDNIEDMSDLCDWLRNHMKPANDREMHIEILPNTYDFRSWMSTYDLHVKGLISTHTEPYANHVWRFSPRLWVTDTEDIEVHHASWQELQQHPEDVILTVKQYMSSSGHSQKPQLSLGFFCCFFSVF